MLKVTAAVEPVIHSVAYRPSFREDIGNLESTPSIAGCNTSIEC